MPSSRPGFQLRHVQPRSEDFLFPLSRPHPHNALAQGVCIRLHQPLLANTKWLRSHLSRPLQASRHHTCIQAVQALQPTNRLHRPRRSGSTARCNRYGHREPRIFLKKCWLCPYTHCSSTPKNSYSNFKWHLGAWNPKVLNQIIAQPTAPDQLQLSVATLLEYIVEYRHVGNESSCPHDNLQFFIG
jgi:hypothetical protein